MLFGPTKQTLDWFSNTVLPDFKKKEGIDVEIRQSDWGSGYQKLLTATASGTLADVTMLGQVMTPALAAKHAFLPINDYLNKWDQTGTFYPAMLKDGTYEGNSYAVPIYADVRTAIYRADLLSKVGVSADGLPKDWDEFKALAEKLSTKNGGSLATPFFVGQNTLVGLMQTYSQMLYQAGGSYFDKSGKSQLSSEHGVKALEYMVSFFKEGLANANVVYQGTGPTPLVQGTSAMTYSGQFEAQNAADNDPSVEKQIIAGLPLSGSKGGKPTTIAWINKLAISAKTKNRDGAWALLSYLASKGNAAKYGELYGGLPARTDLAGASYLKDISPAILGATQYAGALPTSPNLLQIQQQVNIAMQSAIRLMSSPQQVLTQLDQKIDSINGK
ncbi:MAG: extracellular solute-binding protein [Actinomycetota bacterium]|nr:extracellular solute-binding protein [Actinomycetota bacterium]